MNTLEKKNIDWANLGFGYMKTDYGKYLKALIK